MDTVYSEGNTKQWIETLDKIIVALMLAITATLAWPVGLIWWTSAVR